MEVQWDNKDAYLTKSNKDIILVISLKGTEFWFIDRFGSNTVEKKKVKSCFKCLI